MNLSRQRTFIDGSVLEDCNEAHVPRLAVGRRVELLTMHDDVLAASVTDAAGAFTLRSRYLKDPDAQLFVRAGSMKLRLPGRADQNYRVKMTIGCDDEQPHEAPVPTADAKLPPELLLVSEPSSTCDEATAAVLSGCEHVKPHAVRVSPSRIDIDDRIHFAVGSAVIEQRSFAILDKVAVVLHSRTDIALVRIVGRADPRGTASYNLALSANRAQAVMAYLVGRGIDATRLQAVGAGEPAEGPDGANESRWARQRRVEFLVMRAAQQ